MIPDEFTALLVRKEQIQDWLREVEKDRLVRLALSGQPRQARLTRRLLSFLGEQMIVWGRRLLERSGGPVEVPRAVQSGP